jgi:hypothetical protein
MKIDETHHYLAKGDTIRRGDEYGKLEHTFRGPTTWHPVPDHMIGRQASDPKYLSHTNYRRSLYDGVSPREIVAAVISLSNVEKSR